MKLRSAPIFVSASAAPAGNAAVAKNKETVRVRAWSNLRERDAGIHQTKEEQHKLHRRRPPMLKLTEGVDSSIFARIE